MTPEIALLLGIIAVAAILFSFEWIPADVVALGLVVTLTLTGILKPEKAFAGFGSETVMMILGLLIMTAALLRTGVMELAGKLILRHTGTNPSRLLLVIMISAAALSAFMSNTACAAFFVPIVIGLASKAKISPSKLLLPLAFSTILSSSVTLISTSTNIVISGLMTQYQMPPMTMFELAPVGIPIAIVGVLYMFFVGRRLIPERSKPDDSSAFGTRPYVSEIIVSDKSPLVGKTLAEAGLGRDLDVTILSIIRNKNEYVMPRANVTIKVGDVFLIQAVSEALLKIRDTAGVDIKSDVTVNDPKVTGPEARMVEAIILPKSPLIGRTLRGFRFRERYGLQVLGVNRHGENLKQKLSQVPLRMGDVLLVQGGTAEINALQDENAFRVLGAVGENQPQRRRAHRAIFIFVATLALGTFKVVSFPIAVLIGSVAMFVSRCVTPEEAYREVEWKVVILIGSMLALGAAMDSTGTAAYVANLIVQVAQGAGPLALLTGFFILTIVLTQPMSNQAAAVVVLPIAVQTALQLDLNPRTFVMTIAVAASCSYLTPLEPACLMVYGPGRYKFSDFIRVGSILTLLIYIVSILLVPRVWPLHEKGAGASVSVPGAQQKGLAPERANP